ncbi:MAG: hypothetical protein Q8N68_02060, partial [bacterium]|nr:hypothetical protein [bacterium]
KDALKDLVAAELEKRAQARENEKPFAEQIEKPFEKLKQDIDLYRSAFFRLRSESYATLTLLEREMEKGGELLGDHKEIKKLLKKKDKEQSQGVRNAETVLADKGKNFEKKFAEMWKNADAFFTGRRSDKLSTMALLGSRLRSLNSLRDQFLEKNSNLAKSKEGLLKEINALDLDFQSLEKEVFPFAAEFNRRKNNIMNYMKTTFGYGY